MATIHFDYNQLFSCQTWNSFNLRSNSFIFLEIQFLSSKTKTKFNETNKKQKNTETLCYKVTNFIKQTYCTSFPVLSSSDRHITFLLHPVRQGLILGNSNLLTPFKIAKATTDHSSNTLLLHKFKISPFLSKTYFEMHFFYLRFKRLLSQSDHSSKHPSFITSSFLKSHLFSIGSICVNGLARQV